MPGPVPGTHELPAEWVFMGGRHEGGHDDGFWIFAQQNSPSCFIKTIFQKEKAETAFAAPLLFVLRRRFAPGSPADKR
jgi:hypothetical protein